MVTCKYRLRCNAGEGKINEKGGKVNARAYPEVNISTLYRLAGVDIDYEYKG